MERILLLQQLCQLSVALAGTYEAESHNHHMAMSIHHILLALYAKEHRDMVEDEERVMFTNGGEPIPPGSFGPEDTGATMNTASAE